MLFILGCTHIAEDKQHNSKFVFGTLITVQASHHMKILLFTVGLVTLCLLLVLVL